MINQYLIYRFNDMSYSLYAHNKNFEVVLTYGTIDFISNFLSKYFSYFFGPVLGFNILVLIFLLLNIYFSYKLFSEIISNKTLTFLFSLIFSFSIFYLYRAQSFTANFLPTFIFPLFLYLLKKDTKPVITGAILGIFSIFSSYFMFFSGILIALWYLFFKQIKNFIYFLLSFLLLLFLLNFQVILSNIPLLKGIETDVKSENVEEVLRPIEDWYNFSIKPWYFLIPPKNSTFFGDFSKELHSKVSSTGYYLAQNYVEDEMAGVFLGWHFIFGLIFVTLFLFIKPINNKLKNYFEGLLFHRKLIIFCLFSIFSISLISLPPSFTISGIEFFTPSYLLYQIVPFFRVLTRLGVVIFLLVLVINLILFNDILKLIKQIYLKYIFYFIFIVINFLMFSVNLNIINIKNPPQDIERLSEISKNNYLAIPTDYYSIFWGSFINSNLYSISSTKTSNLDILNNFSYKVFSKDANFLSKVDTIIIYKNKFSSNNFTVIKKINNDINSLQDILNYLENTFGKKVYEDDQVIIFIKI